MRRFVLFWLFDRWGAHLKHRFERLGGAGFVFADGFGGWLFGVGFRGVELVGAGGRVAHRGCDCGVAGDVWFVFVFVYISGVRCGLFLGCFWFGLFLLGLGVSLYFFLNGTGQRFLFLRFRGHARGWLRFGGCSIALGVGFLSLGSRGANACFLEGLLGGT